MRTECVRKHVMHARADKDIVATKLGIILLLFGANVVRAHARGDLI